MADHDFARAAAQLGVNSPALAPLATKDYPTPAQRPRNSVLSNAKLLSRFGVRLSPWQSALDAVFQALVSDNVAPPGPTQTQSTQK